MAVEVKLRGLEQLKRELKALAPNLRRRAIRNALSAGARVFRDEARRLAPILDAPIISKGKVIRVPGTLKKAIRVRTSKQARRAGDVGVFVNVKPARGSDRGTAKDPFYWRFVEFGASQAQAKPFLRPAANSKMGEALKKIEATLGPQIRKLNK